MKKIGICVVFLFMITLVIPGAIAGSTAAGKVVELRFDSKEAVNGLVPDSQLTDFYVFKGDIGNAAYTGQLGFDETEKAAYVEVGPSSNPTSDKHSIKLRIQGKPGVTPIICSDYRYIVVKYMVKTTASNNCYSLLRDSFWNSYVITEEVDKNVWQETLVDLSQYNEWKGIRIGDDEGTQQLILQILNYNEGHDYTKETGFRLYLQSITLYENYPASATTVPGGASGNDTEPKDSPNVSPDDIPATTVPGDASGNDTEPKDSPNVSPDDIPASTVPGEASGNGSEPEDSTDAGLDDSTTATEPDVVKENESESDDFFDVNPDDSPQIQQPHPFGGNYIELRFDSKEAVNGLVPASELVDFFVFKGDIGNAPYTGQLGFDETEGAAYVEVGPNSNPTAEKQSIKIRIQGKPGVTPINCSDYGYLVIKYMVKTTAPDNCFSLLRDSFWGSYPITDVVETNVWQETLVNLSLSNEWRSIKIGDDEGTQQLMLQVINYNDGHDYTNEAGFRLYLQSITFYESDPNPSTSEPADATGNESPSGNSQQYQQTPPPAVGNASRPPENTDGGEADNSGDKAGSNLLWVILGTIVALAVVCGGILLILRRKKTLNGNGEDGGKGNGNGSDMGNDRENN